MAEGLQNLIIIGMKSKVYQVVYFFLKVCCCFLFFFSNDWFTIILVSLDNEYNNFETWITKSTSNDINPIILHNTSKLLLQNYFLSIGSKQSTKAFSKLNNMKSAVLPIPTTELKSNDK